MTASVGLLSTIVIVALIMTIATPIILLILLIKDLKRGTQW